jgi:transcriptional regulator with XRE-family HTH domain
MLKSLLDNKMRDERLSVRKAARMIGISHVTLIRALAGNTSQDVDTLDKITRWLGVQMSDVLNIEQGKALEERIAHLVRTQPEFAKILEQTLVEVDRGNLTKEDLAEIVAFANYRLGRRGNVAKVRNDEEGG